jgi:hypothetical protein
MVAITVDRSRLFLRGSKQGRGGGEDAPSLFGQRIDDAGTAIARMLARPLQDPGSAFDRSQQRLRRRNKFQVRPQIHDQQPVIISRSAVSEHEGLRSQHGAVERHPVLPGQDAILATQAQQVPVQLVDRRMARPF